MTVNRVSSENTPHGIGLRFRTPQDGPEAELVDRFMKRQLIQVPRNLSVSAFCEPKLESGVPDIVFVIWDETIASSWIPARANLKKNDIRLLHFIYQHGPVSDTDIAQSYPASQSCSLERLLNADLLLRTRSCYRTRPLSHIFAVKRIIAIEAKIKSPEIALSQAVMNTWFASDSFVLVPRLSRGTDLYENAKRLGIRVLDEHSQDVSVALSASRSLPRSYASWQFNEWVWLSRPYRKRKKA